MKNYRWRRSLVTATERVLAEKHLLPFGCIQEYWKVLTEYWANNDAVQKALHVRKGTIRKWLRCDKGAPYKRWEIKSSIEYHQNISTKGYRSLIYSGDHDMTVPHISTEAWIRSLPNMSVTDYWRPWFVRKQVAGYTRTYSNGLTYATIKGGGHVAAKYKPEECQAMFERWISNTPL
ncbi:hypothetical protein MKW94_000328 [Papaver nudicaule]|uniref:Serine carboxypeptidase n=1 Tax=Papaver nudicaule TaxID=74823 RepID=A0AA41VC09_PAPNU|nr:hypothetical protein [Papaver nudicaule]